MTTYFLDDAANGTNDGLSWETCYNTWAQVNTAAILTAANVLYVGADANITDHGAALTISGPTTGLPTTIISSTVGAGTTVSYSRGTGAQVNTASGAYAITFDGSFAVYGLRCVAGSTTNSAGITLDNDNNESFFAEEMTLVPGVNSVINLGAAQALRKIELINTLIDLSADGATARSAQILSLNQGGINIIRGLSFSGNSWRSRSVIDGANTGGFSQVSNVDFSGFTYSSGGTICELADYGATAQLHISNSLTESSAVYVNTASTPLSGTRIEFVNVGSADNPEQYYLADYAGFVASSRSIYRTGGATIESVEVAWLVTTTANCIEMSPLQTPWIYGTTTAGSKTFDLYITNDTADFDDDEVWLEVEYLSTADEAIWSLASDQRATITATAAAQTDDVASTWNGAGPAYTYKQKLSVTATVGEAGQYRARVCVGVASIASSRYFYIDPKVTVS